MSDSTNNMKNSSSKKSSSKRKSPAEILPDITDVDAEPIPGCSTSSPLIATAESKGKKRKKVSFQDTQPFFTDEEETSSDSSHSETDSSASDSSDTDIVISSDEDDQPERAEPKIDKIKVSNNGKLISRMFRSATVRRLKATINHDNLQSFLVVRKKTANGPKTVVLDVKAAQHLTNIHDKFLKKCEKLRERKKTKKSTKYLIKKDLKGTAERVTVSFVKLSGLWFVAVSNWSRKKHIHLSVHDYEKVVSFLMEHIRK